MNNKFFQVNCKIQFNKQGGKGIPNLVYKISFSDKTGKILHTFNGKTDQNGATAPLLLDKNGTLKIMVEGYKTPFSKKGVMEPPFVKHNNIIEINESALDKNANFMTLEQYNKKKL